MPVILIEYDTGDTSLPNPSLHTAGLYDDSEQDEDDDLDDSASNSDSPVLTEHTDLRTQGSIIPEVFPSFANHRDHRPGPLRMSSESGLTSTNPDHSISFPLSPLSKGRPRSGIVLKGTEPSEIESEKTPNDSSDQEEQETYAQQLQAQTPIDNPVRSSSESDTRQENSPASKGIGKLQFTGNRTQERLGTSSGSIWKARRRYSTAAGFTTADRRKPGWEPGIDIKTTDVIIESIGSAITIVDYSVDRCRLARTEFWPEDEIKDSTDINGDEELMEYLQNRPKWSKVRWINVNGLSKKAIYTIGQYYNLHKLAIEDMVDIPQRTKVDEYPTHTFCCLPLHRLIPYKPTVGAHATYSRMWYFMDRIFGRFRSAPKSNQTTTNNTASLGSSRTGDGMTMPHEDISSRPEPLTLRNQLAASSNLKSIYHWNNPTQRQWSDYLESRRPLASRHKMVGVEQVSLFLTNQRTVISFFEQSGEEIERPILERLETDSTILRETSDPSILLQAIIDAIVDLINPIIGAYRSRLNELELAAILNPSMAHTRDLHLISGDLTLLRNSIALVTSLINSLRDHARQGGGEVRRRKGAGTGGSGGGGGIEDVDDVAAIVSSSTSFAGTTSTTDRKLSNDWDTSGLKVTEYASVYLADVADHTLSYSQDLDIMRGNAKSMIDLIFNTISIQSSDAVKLLSLVTVIFLPLSFLTGYFGMNFTEFEDLNNGVGYYWAIAVPCAATMTVILMYPWVRDNLRKVTQVAYTAHDVHSRKKRRRRHRAKRRSSDLV